MFGALKRGFRSMASLILVSNVVGELQPKRTLAASRGFLAAARLSYLLLRRPTRDEHTHLRASVGYVTNISLHVSLKLDSIIRSVFYFSQKCHHRPDFLSRRTNERKHSRCFVCVLYCELKMRIAGLVSNGNAGNGVPKAILIM